MEHFQFVQLIYAYNVRPLFRCSRGISIEHRPNTPLTAEILAAPEERLAVPHPSCFRHQNMISCSLAVYISEIIEVAQPVSLIRWLADVVLNLARCSKPH